MKTLWNHQNEKKQKRLSKKEREEIAHSTSDRYQETDRDADTEFEVTDKEEEEKDGGNDWEEWEEQNEANFLSTDNESADEWLP